jgi:hypothetical protein
VSVQELRVYHVAPGRLDALARRFRDAALPLFARHGIAVTGPWVTRGEDGDLLVYLVAFDSEEEREDRLAAFRADPQWQHALTTSERDGPLTDRIDVLPLQPLPG